MNEDDKTPYAVAVLVAVVVLAVALGGMYANAHISTDRHAAIVACIEAGGDPLVCREGVR